MGGNYEKGLYNQLMEVMARLDAVEEDLHVEKIEHKNDVDRLNAKIDCLTEENRLLKDDNARLKSIINNDSSNTSIPPFTDQKGGKPANTYNSCQHTGRKAGGQKGHKGTTLTKEEVEEKIRSGKCRHEVREIGDPSSQKYVTKYVVDLDVTPMVTEIRIYPDKNGKFNIPDEYRITGSGEAAERDSTIAVLVVEPGKEPYVKEIDSDLKSLQHEVGGCIEAIYPYEDPVALVCNEEGKLEGLPLNRALRDEDGDIYDVVAGTFMVVGLTDDSFGSLTVEQMQKFSDLFKVPEQFVKLGDKIVAIPMISKEQQKQESIEQKDFEMNADTSGLTVAGHIGTWHTIDQHEVGGHSFYLMEHDTYGDEAACIIVDERGKLVLDDVYNGFDDDTLRLLDLEVKEVPEMPDPALSVQDMKDYGYAWAGVLPAGQEAAEKALEKGCEVYRLYSDNTEGLCVDAKEIADHAAKGGMLGISKESWMAALEKENYLKAAEMSMEDDYGMIDGIINNGPKEDKTLDAKAPETREKSSIMDRLKAAKGVKQKECCPPKKHKGEIEL